MKRSKAFFGKCLGWKDFGGSLGGHVGSTTTPCGLGGDENEVYFCTWDLKELEPETCEPASRRP